MAEAKLTSRGQLVIPKAVRQHLHLQTGDTVDFVIQNGGEVVVHPVIKDVGELKGLLKKKRTPVSLEQMDEAIHKRAGRKI